MTTPHIEALIEPAPMDALVGLLSFEFNGLELELTGLIARTLRVDAFAVEAIVARLQWMGRLDLLNRAFLKRTDLTVLHPYWKTLHLLLADVGADRNFVVHGWRQAASDAKGKVRWSIIPTKYHFSVPMVGLDGQNYYFHNDYARRSGYEVDESELREIILDARAALNAVLALDQFLAGGDRTLDELLDLQIRRRPPYGQRGKPQ